jgi:hypothetical protein
MTKCKVKTTTKHSTYFTELFFAEVVPYKKSCEENGWKFEILYWIGGNDECFEG